MYMWTYSNGAIATLCFDWDGVNTAAEAFQNAGNWVGVVFCVQAVGSLLWAVVLPVLEGGAKNKGAYAMSLLVGASGFVSIFFLFSSFSLCITSLCCLSVMLWLVLLGLPCWLCRSRS